SLSRSPYATCGWVVRAGSGGAAAALAAADLRGGDRAVGGVGTAAADGRRCRGLSHGAVTLCLRRPLRACVADLSAPGRAGGRVAAADLDDAARLRGAVA